MNIVRARHVLEAPELPWTTDVKRELAQAYLDHVQQIAMLLEHIERLERERAQQVQAVAP